MTTRLDFSAVLFDVDGTLIDSNAAHADAWSSALREAGFHIDVSQVRPLIGMGGDKLLPALVGIAEDSEQGKAFSARKKELFSERLPRLQPTRGARDLIAFLRSRDITIVVATSSGKDDMRKLLERAGVADLIEEHASKDDAARSKPDPDIVKAALAEGEVAAKDAIFVGDTPYDIEAAGRAGVKTIALRCGGHWADKDLAGAVKIVDDPAALLEDFVKGDVCFTR